MIIAALLVFTLVLQNHNNQKPKARYMVGHLPFLPFLLSGKFVPLFKLLSGYVSGFSGTCSVYSEDDWLFSLLWRWLSVGDSSSERLLSCQTLTFPQVILVIFDLLKDILANFSHFEWHAGSLYVIYYIQNVYYIWHILYINIHVSSLALISNKHSSNVYLAYHLYHLYFWR